ncbi:hypothetical protein C0989_011559 [Termitomyces sp. Mn162]|nr:hypothetical protein C0989_011559 [Termitomyces sp. Mn162]
MPFADLYQPAFDHIAIDLDARDGQPPTTALGGTPSNPLGTTAKSFPGGGSTNEDNDILTKGPLAKGLISRSIPDIERPWTKRQPIDDPTEGGLYTDKSYRYFTEAGSYDLDNKSPVSQMGKSLNKGSSAESGLSFDFSFEFRLIDDYEGVPVGKELTDPKVDKTKSQLGPSNPTSTDFVEVIRREQASGSDVRGLKARRAMEPVEKRFHAHNRHPRSRVFSKRDSPSDIDILNFALTFEHLVSAFYKAGLERYGAKQFQEAGYEVWMRKRYKQLAKNGNTHVQFLESALGERGVKACSYDLKEKDVKEWVSKSFVIENVAASVWNGVVGILQDRAYQTVAASIMGVKSRQAAWINSVVRKSNAWNTPFETPLDMNQVYSIISPFIIPGSCPSTNAPIRATPFPALHVPPCHPGSVITLEFDASLAKGAEKKKEQLFAAFVSGTGTVFVSMREGRKVEVPKGLVGIVYVFVTKDGGKVGTEGIVAGPGVVWFGFRA